jgi:hypothetical protein
MPRNLTTRQLKFAAAVASGKTQIAAFEEAGYGVSGKRTTAVRNAKKTAQNAEVRAAIEKMRRQLLPDPGDVREIRTHAMAVIVGLSMDAEDEKVRLAAGQWLYEETGKQMAQIAERERLEAGRAARTPDHLEVVAQLRALYRKALPGQEPPLVEAVSDETADGLAGEAAAENLPLVAEPLVEVVAARESACAEDEGPEPDEAATEEVSLVAEKLNPAVQFRMERVPGFFPARFRRVPIEP